MPLKERRKGIEFEREVVKAATTMGLEARRTALNQTQDGSRSYGDVTIAGRKVECKHHKRVPGWRQVVCAALLHDKLELEGQLGKWLAGNDALIIKQTGYSVPLVVLPGGRVLALRDWLLKLQEEAVEPRL